MSKYYKYPRTMHLPWSESVGHDDSRIACSSIFDNKEVVVTEKMDGENTSFYCDNLHARSLDSRNHPSRDWIKNWHYSFAYNIPNGWRVCGENLFAKHSIQYNDLDHYFYGFSVWDDENTALSWDDTISFFQSLNITPVPVIYEGVWNESEIKEIAINIDRTKSEGYVVRLKDSFHYDDFKSSVAKWVRANHVQSESHWMASEIIKNKLNY